MPQNVCMAHRIIRLVGEINEQMYLTLSKRLATFEAESTTKLIDIELSSGGGSTVDALAIVGRMRASNVVLRVTAYGTCQSAAVLILAAGDYRRISSECWVMVHEESSKLSGSTSEIANASRHMDREEQHWNDLLAQYTQTPSEAWAKLARETTYLDAKQAFQLGLADEIFKGKK